MGQISESDVTLASASQAIIIGFQVRPSQAARKYAAFNGLEPEEFRNAVRENINRLQRCYKERETEEIRQKYKQVNDDEVEALKMQIQLRDKIKLRTGDK